jgi:hypothetical protein
MGQSHISQRKLLGLGLKAEMAFLFGQLDWGILSSKKGGLRKRLFYSDFVFVQLVGFFSNALYF